MSGLFRSTSRRGNGRSRRGRSPETVESEAARDGGRSPRLGAQQQQHGRTAVADGDEKTESRRSLPPQAIAVERPSETDGASRRLHSRDSSPHRHRQPTRRPPLGPSAAASVRSEGETDNVASSAYAISTRQKAASRSSAPHQRPIRTRLQRSRSADGDYGAYTVTAAGDIVNNGTTKSRIYSSSNTTWLATDDFDWHIQNPTLLQRSIQQALDTRQALGVGEYSHSDSGSRTHHENDRLHTEHHQQDPNTQDDSTAASAASSVRLLNDTANNTDNTDNSNRIATFEQQLAFVDHRRRTRSHSSITTDNGASHSHSPNINTNVRDSIEDCMTLTTDEGDLSDDDIDRDLISHSHSIDCNDTRSRSLHRHESNTDDSLRQIRGITYRHPAVQQSLRLSMTGDVEMMCQSSGHSSSRTAHFQSISIDPGSTVRTARTITSTKSAPAASSIAHRRDPYAFLNDTNDRTRADSDSSSTSNNDKGGSSNRQNITIPPPAIPQSVRIIDKSDPLYKLHKQRRKRVVRGIVGGAVAGVVLGPVGIVVGATAGGMVASSYAKQRERKDLRQMEKDVLKTAALQDDRLVRQGYFV